MARTKAKRTTTADQEHLTVHLPLKRPLADRFKAVADREHRRLSDQIRAFAIEGLERSELTAATN